MPFVTSQFMLRNVLAQIPEPICLHINSSAGISHCAVCPGLDVARGDLFWGLEMTESTHLLYVVVSEALEGSLLDLVG